MAAAGGAFVAGADELHSNDTTSSMDRDTTTTTTAAAADRQESFRLPTREWLLKGDGEDVGGGGGGGNDDDAAHEGEIDEGEIVDFEWNEDTKGEEQWAAVGEFSDDRLECYFYTYLPELAIAAVDYQPDNVSLEYEEHRVGEFDVPGDDEAAEE